MTAASEPLMCQRLSSEERERVSGGKARFSMRPDDVFCHARPARPSRYARCSRIISLLFLHAWLMVGGTASGSMEGACTLLESSGWMGQDQSYRIAAPNTFISGMLLPVQIERRGEAVQISEQCHVCWSDEGREHDPVCKLVMLHKGRGSTALRLNAELDIGPRTVRVAVLSVAEDDAIEKELASTLTTGLPARLPEICDEVVGGVLADEQDLSWPGNAVICVNSTVRVPFGKILQVHAGTTILVSDRADVIVHGILQVLGTLDSPVLWIPMQLEPWGGLELRGRDEEALFPNLLLHSWFLGGGGSRATYKQRGHSESQPVVLVESSGLTMIGGGVTDSPGKAFYARSSVVQSYCTHIARCDTGGEYENSHLHLEGAVVIEVPNSEWRGLDDDNDGVYLLGKHPTIKGPSAIRGCIFAQGDDDAIDHNGADLIVEDTFIGGFKHEGVAVSNMGEVTVVGCEIVDCSTGIEGGYGRPGSQVLIEVRDTIISGCGFGFFVGDDYDLVPERYPRQIFAVCCDIASNVQGIGSLYSHQLQNIMLGDESCLRSAGESGRATKPLPGRPCDQLEAPKMGMDYWLPPESQEGNWKRVNVKSYRGKLVAVLVMMEEQMERIKLRGPRLLQSMTSIAQLMRHKGLARILDLCIDDKSGQISMVQEFAPGLSLGRILFCREHNCLPDGHTLELTPSVAYTFALTMADTIAYFHSNSPASPVLVGDLKVEHIYIQHDGSIILIDWDESLWLVKFMYGVPLSRHRHCCSRSGNVINVFSDHSDCRIAPECFWCDCTLNACCHSSYDVTKTEVFTYGYILEKFLSLRLESKLYDAHSNLWNLLDEIVSLTKQSNANRPFMVDIVAKLHAYDLKLDSTFRGLVPGGFGILKQEAGWKLGYDEWISLLRTGTVDGVDMLKVSPVAEHSSRRGAHGASFRVHLSHTTGLSEGGVGVQARGYFKSVGEDWEEYESEVALSRLDKLLGVGATAPCVRRELNLDELDRTLTFGLEDLRFFRKVQSEDDSKSYIRGGRVNGSLCAWFDTPVSDEFEDWEVLEDALTSNVEVLNSMGSCGKSDHNRFVTLSQSRPLALDNDRCFLYPEEYMQSRHWHERPVDMSWWRPWWLASCETIPQHMATLLLLSGDDDKDTSFGNALKLELMKEESIELDASVISQVNANLRIIQQGLMDCGLSPEGEPPVLQMATPVSGCQL